MKKEVKAFLVMAILVSIAVIIVNKSFPPEVEIVKRPAVEQPLAAEEPEEEQAAEPVAAQEEETLLEPSENRVVVQILYNKYEPSTLTIKPGTMVVFFNKDTKPHKVVMQDRSFISKRILPGGSDFHYFKQPGEFIYFDAVFNYMDGKVIVKDDTESFASVTGGVVANIRQFFKALFRLG